MYLRRRAELDGEPNTSWFKFREPKRGPDDKESHFTTLLLLLVVTIRTLLRDSELTSDSESLLFIPEH